MLYSSEVTIPNLHASWQGKPNGRLNKAKPKDRFKSLLSVKDPILYELTPHPQNFTRWPKVWRVFYGA